MGLHPNRTDLGGRGGSQEWKRDLPLGVGGDIPGNFFTTHR